MPTIVVQPGKTIRILEGDTQKLKITMMWGKQGGGLPTASAFAILAVYDLDLYIQHQRDLSKANGDVGFFETSEKFFRTTNQKFPAQPQDHKVAPGTGVMLQARLRFGFSDDKSKTANVDFFVTQVQTEGDISPKPYALDVQVLGRFDAAGQPIAGGKVEFRSIGQAAVARADFDKFFFGNFALERKIAIRVFKSDGGASTGVNELSQVLLSSLDKDQSSTSKGTSGPAKHEALYTKLHPSKTLIPRNVGDPAPNPQKGGALPSRLRDPDLTGFYVEEVKKNINAQGIREIDPMSVVSPSGLFIHQAGHATVAWYSPLPNVTLAAKEAGFGPDSDIVKGMLSETGHLVFVGPMLELPSELQGKVPAVMPKGATPMLYFDDKAAVSPLEMDPVDILRKKKGIAPVQVGWMRVIDESLLTRSVEFGTESGRKAEFLLLHTGSRLSWEAIKLLRKSAQVNGLPDAGFIKDTLKERAQPLPPAVTANLVKKLVGIDMFNRLKEISELPPQGETAKRLVVEDKIIKIVDSVVGPLKQHQVANFRVMAQTTMRSHSFFFAGDGDRSVFERLVTVATNIIVRQNPLATTNVNSAALVPASFKELGIHPTVGFRYKIDFTAKGISRGTFLQASAGGFLLEITRLVEVPRKSLSDPQIFVLDKQFDAPKNSSSAKYFGFYVGGGVGFSLGLGVKGLEKGGAGSGEPLSCEITTFHEISAQDFDRASFNTASFVRPGFGIQGGPITFNSSSHDSVMTIRISEEVQITGSVTTPLFDPKVDGPTKEGIIDHYKKWHDALKSGGDITDAPAASANITLAALTTSWGVLFKRDTPAQELPKPDKEDEVPDPTNLNVDQTIGAVTFDRGSSTIDEASHRALDVTLATARQLFELEGWMVLFAGASPQYGHLNRSDSRAQNFNLAKFRADTTKRAIFASLGNPGSGIIPEKKEIQDGIDVESAIRDTLAPAPGTTDVTMLDPFGDVAKTAEGKKVVQQEERDIYRSFQRCDIIVAGVLAVRLPSR